MSSPHVDGGFTVGTHRTLSGGRSAGIRGLIRDDRGTVESGLVLIPLTVFFLFTTQLVFMTHWGNWQRFDQQSSADVVAIHGSTSAINVEDSFSYEPLIGGGYLLVSRREVPIPLIANFSILNRGKTQSQDVGRGHIQRGSGTSGFGGRVSQVDGSDGGVRDSSSFTYSKVTSALSEVFTR